MARNYHQDHAFAESCYPKWLQYYDQRFGEYMLDTVPDNTREQRLGCDRVVYVGGETVVVEEKVSRLTAPIIPVEFISNTGATDVQKYKGWAERDLLCDEFAIMCLGLYEPQVFVFPWEAFFATWERRKEKWLERYGHKVVGNTAGKGSYNTLYCPVPIIILLSVVPGSTAWYVE